MIHQMNISFNAEEDRLILRMTANDAGAMVEYRVWLTRRFVRLLLQSLHQSLGAGLQEDKTISPEHQQAMLRFQQESVLAKTDFTTPFAEVGAALPLGPTPLLVSKATITKDDNGSHLLGFQGAGAPCLNLTLTPDLLHAFIKLLAQGVKNAQWDFDLPMPMHDPTTGLAVPTTVH